MPSGKCTKSVLFLTLKRFKTAQYLPEQCSKNDLLLYHLGSLRLYQIAAQRPILPLAFNPFFYFFR
jgi:hypothetical protein